MSQVDLSDDAHDDDVLADLFDTLLQAILDGRTPDIAAYQRKRPDLADRIAKTWSLACSVAGRREPSRPTFGGYEILRELGHGGMGTVYLARHQTLQRDVAVKVLPQSLAMSPHAKQRFLEEARALAQLRHENVVHIHRVVDHTEMLAFEMEFIDGPSLQQVLVELRQAERPNAVEALARVLHVEPQQLGSRNTVEWFVRITIRIARALGEVHRRGLLHRDVKPANILLRKGGTPVLADFGLALQGDLDSRQRKFAGTPVYAAPERLRGDEDHTDVRTDVYSLGVTLYEALTMTPPFQGTTTDEVLRRIENGRAAPLRTRTSLVSRDLETIVGKAMEVEPRHRYDSADALADDLERLLALQPILARPAGPLRRAYKFVRRHQKAATASLCSALLVTAIAWPLAALAANREDMGRVAASARHAARTELLGLEVVQAPWQPGDHEQPSASRQARREALIRARRHYTAALAATPEDAMLRHEAAAVEAAVAMDDGPTALAAATTEARAIASFYQEKCDHRTDAFASPAPRETLFAAGLLAFLTGNSNANDRLWRQLPDDLTSEALVDACTALRHAREGAAAAAYPRVFHAARAFPGATALVVAMADGAVQAGDLEMARRWLVAIPVAEDPLRDAQRRLVAADLLAAEGQVEAAETEYRRLQYADASDPRPQLHLAQLLWQQGELKLAARLWQSTLRRWPSLHAARMQLARYRLQCRDLPGFLALIRDAEHAEPFDPGQVLQLLRLGGLRARSGDGFATCTGPGPDPLPLRTWLSPDLTAGIERALDVLPVLDDIRRTAHGLDSRPIGVGLFGVAIAALRFHDLTLQLPTSGRLAVTVLPLLLWQFTDQLSQQILPYQTILGDPVHRVEDRVLFRVETDPTREFFGLEVLHLGDVDGDTLDDLCFSVPPIGAASGGAIELRNASDGHLLDTWRSDAPHAAFARAVTSLGDVDGDLCDDIVVGMPLMSLPDKELAAVELRSGRTGRTIWRLEHEQLSFGAAMTRLGDVDGDGVPDLAIGVPPLSLRQTGRVWLCSGRTGERRHELSAEAAGTWFGAALANAGDLTGDGRTDLLVGGNYGGAPGHVVAFDGASGDVLFELDEPDPELAHGSVLVGIEDLDGDGQRDFAVSAPGRRNSKVTAGAVLLISGRTRQSFAELHGERIGENFGSRLLYVPG
ncbi:MAG: protein kinase [Planctomycetes bacterium]|nr:protein kinase [Planctomycetota bacterium]